MIDNSKVYIIVKKTCFLNHFQNKNKKNCGLYSRCSQPIYINTMSDPIFN